MKFYRGSFVRGGLIRGSALAWLLLALFGAPAFAQVHRTAVIVGSNEGAAGRSALRFAESDAAKLARVLVELGGFAAEDVYLFRGRPVEDVRRGFGAVARKVAAPLARDVVFHEYW